MNLWPSSDEETKSKRAKRVRGPKIADVKQKAWNGIVDSLILLDRQKARKEDDAMYNWDKKEEWEKVCN